MCRGVCFITDQLLLFNSKYVYVASEIPKQLLHNGI